MYVHTPEYTWVEWEWDPEAEGLPAESECPRGFDFAGFRAKIRANPTVGEVRAELKARQKTLTRPQEMTDEDYLRVIAPRVPAWEFEQENAAGARVAVPAPGEQPDNELAFDLLELPLRNWLLRQIRNAHLPKVTIPASTPAGSTEPANPTESIPETALPTS